MNWQKYFWSALGMGATVGSGLLYYAAKIEPEKLRGHFACIASSHSR